MSYPTDRDALARHLYITTPDPCGEEPVPLWEQNVLAQRWDNGGAVAEYAADCYARADRILAGQVTR